MTQDNTPVSNPTKAQYDEAPDSVSQALSTDDANRDHVDSRCASDPQSEGGSASAEVANTGHVAEAEEAPTRSLPQKSEESLDSVNFPGEGAPAAPENEEASAHSPNTTASSVGDHATLARRRRIPKLAECPPYVPGPSLEPVLRDLLPVRENTVLIGPWETQPFKRATYFYTNPALLTKARAIVMGSKGSVERAIRNGLPLSRNHPIEAGRIVRDLPDLAHGAPVRGARDIIVLQPQEHEEVWRLARLIRGIAAPGARVVLLGFEAFSVSEEIDAIIHPLLRGLLGVTNRAQRHYYGRFRRFPLPLQDDPAFDHTKKRFGEVTWTYEDLVTYLDLLPSVKRLKKVQLQNPAKPHLPFDGLRDLARLDRLKKAWGASTKKRKVSFQLVVRCGFLPN